MPNNHENEALKREIAGAMYDLLLLKGETREDANRAVKNTVDRKENISEYTLLRFLTRLQVAHTNRSSRLPLHWTERIRELKAKYPADARAIAREVKVISRLDRNAQGKRQPRQTRRR